MELGELFAILAGKKLDILCCLFEADVPMTSKDVAKSVSCSVATARNTLRSMACAGLVSRQHGGFAPSKGRGSDLYEMPARVRKWWLTTSETFRHAE